MFLSTLPDLTPRDVSLSSQHSQPSPIPLPRKCRTLIISPTPQLHNLFHTTRHPPTTVPTHLLTPHDPTQQRPQDAQHQHDPRDRDARRVLLERTPLARLRHDEAVMDRRRANVANYGTAWLKPPGVAKTLFQLREERREVEEHVESMRREQMLAAQHAAEAGRDEGGGDEDMMMGDGGDELDLDGDIPEAEGFGFDGEDSSGEEEDMEETMAESEGGEETENIVTAVMVSPAEESQVREVRAAEDRLMDLMARGDGTSDFDEAFGDDAGAEGSEEMLEEADLLHNAHSPPPPATGTTVADVSIGMDMDMDADLDGSIPDGDGDEYEHTDSDEEIDEATRDISFAGRSSVARLRRSMHHHRSSVRSRGSLVPSEALDISELLSGEGSSFMEASPYPRRRG